MKEKPQNVEKTNKETKRLLNQHFFVKRKWEEGNKSCDP